jgi:DNA-3-methyladenine glycosylase II
MPRASTEVDPWKPACEHLIRVDASWASRIGRVGPCRLRPIRDRFGTLAQSIISQQISTKAARSIHDRLKNRAGGQLDPASILALNNADLRGAGLSGQKASYLVKLAESVHSGRLPLAGVARWDDEEVIARLTEVKGIGRWTAEMFLIFSLNRPDVWPVDDLGIRHGIRSHFGLAELPPIKLCRELGEPWRPFRTAASWYLWQDRNDPPA